MSLEKACPYDSRYSLEFLLLFCLTIKKNEIAYYKHIKYVDIKTKRMLSGENTESNSSSCQNS